MTTGLHDYMNVVLQKCRTTALQDYRNVGLQD